METILYEKILVATDYTDLAENAVKTASVLCQQHDAELVFLHVVRDVPAYTPDFEFNPTQNYTKELKIAAQSEIKRFGDNIRKEYNIDVEEVVAYGEVVEEIVKSVEEKHPDMVLVGTHGASGFRRFFIGSTAYRVIKHTRYPVMTIPGKGDWTDFKNILFPIRYIPDALKKYDCIRPIIQRNKPILNILGLTLESESDKMEKVFRLEEELEKKLKEDKVNFNVAYRCCDNFADEILEVADKKKVDLIVIVATLDKSKGEFFIGPFSQQILNHAKVPVLCVRP
ncbi:MAG: universal stress protein [Bacteroidota bacterium]|nr:universal stress protein [Bacteroidota bacterium]